MANEQQDTEELETLQEQALQRELPIFGEDGETPLTAVELQVSIDNFEMAQLAQDEQSPTPQPPLDRTPKAPQEAPKAAKPAAAPKPAPKPAKPVPAVKAPASKRPAGPPSASPELLKAVGLGEPSQADHQLAAKHGYPVAVTGAKPYHTSISFWEPFAQRLAEPGQVVLLIDAHASNKLEYLTPVDD